MSFTQTAVEEAALEEFLNGLLEWLSSSLGGLVVGSLITLVVATIVYRVSDKSLKNAKSEILEASRELKADAERIRRMINVVSLALEDAGLAVNVVRDKDGYPTAIAVNLSGSLKGNSKFGGKLTDDSSGA